MIKVADIARQVGAVVEGDGELEIHGVSGIREAQAGEITFMANPKYALYAVQTKATAVLVRKEWDRPCSSPALLRVDDPDKAFAMIAMMFAPPAVNPPPGVHPTAIIAPDVQLGKDVSIGPYCVVEPGCRIGAGTILFAGCYLGHGVKVGTDCRFYPHVSAREHVQIGDRVIIHNGTVIGSDGFGYNVDKKGVRTKIPQIGIVVIGDDVEIGANVTIDRARFGKTRIGNGVKIDNLVQIAHNVVIGDHAVVVAQAGIAGSSMIGAHAILAGQAGITGHVKIGERAVVGAQSGISKDVPPGAFMFGSPAIPFKEFTEVRAHSHRLPELKKKIADLEKRIQQLEKNG